MADLFLVSNATCPASTGTSAPVTALSIGAGPWQLAKVTIVIPPGHAMLTGIQLWYGGNTAIPYLSGWYCGDDEVIPLELSDSFPQGVPWSVAMINSDVIAHTWQTRWELNYVAPGTVTTPAKQLAVGDIYSAASDIVTGG